MARLNDTVDAGDIGAGHSVTTLYEVTPVDTCALIDKRRYGTTVTPPQEEQDFQDEYAFLKIRCKLQVEPSSRLITRPVTTADLLDPRKEEQKWLSN